MNDNLEYKLAVGFGGFAALGWLAIALTRLLNWYHHKVAANSVTGDLRKEILDFGGTLWVDGIFALIAAAVFCFVVYKLLQTSWNGWDWATAVTGGAAVLSLVMLCAQQRVIALLPFTFFPQWLLLYRPGVKQVCGVGVERAASDSGLGGDRSADVDEAPNRRSDLDSVMQRLRVFEVERGMDTTTFVDRYVDGLEDDTPDNVEWFDLARQARRAGEQRASGNGAVSHG